MVAALRHFCFLLEGRSFHVLTDLKPLVFALHRARDAWSSRQGRHLAYVAELTSDLHHMAGADNVVADCLSMPPEELSLPRSIQVAGVMMLSGLGPLQRRRQWFRLLSRGPSDRVARSTEAFTATSTKNHGHFGTFHGHQIFCYGHFHGHIWGRNTLKSRKYIFAFVLILSSIKRNIKVGCH